MVFLHCKASIYTCICDMILLCIQYQYLIVSSYITLGLEVCDDNFRHISIFLLNLSRLSNISR